MKNNDQLFLDYETGKALAELNADLDKISFKTIHCYNESGAFIETDEDYVPFKHIHAPLWQQVKIWLWEKHQVNFVVEHGLTGLFAKTVQADGQSWVTPDYGSPVEAEIEAIKNMVERLLKLKK